MKSREGLNPRTRRLVSVLRSLPLFASLLCVASLGWSEEEKAQEKDATSRIIVGDNVKNWKILMTVQGGGGLEAVRFGWHSVQVDSDGKATVRKHAGLQGGIDVFDENAIASSNAVVTFQDKITEEHVKAVVGAAAAAVNNFELQPKRGSRADDGWRVTLKIKRDRREVSVAAKELANVSDAGENFPRLIEAINKFLPAKATIDIH